MEEIKPEKIQEMLNDKETFKKILQIINLQQEERLIEWHKDKINREIGILKSEINIKHKLGILDLPMLLWSFQQEEYKDFIDKYKKKWEKK